MTLRRTAPSGLKVAVPPSPRPQAEQQTEPLFPPEPATFSGVFRLRRWMFPALTATVILVLIIALGATSKDTHTHTPGNARKPTLASVR